MREEHAGPAGPASPDAGLRAGLRLLVAGLLLLGVGDPAAAATYSGRVFEDANFGGGVGRSFADSGGTGVSGARVELYRVSDGAFLTSTTTNGSGNYTLTTNGGNAGTAVRVRVVNATVRSARAGGSGCSACVPVQTFRTNVANGSNAVSAVTDRVGGENPALSDAVAGANGTTWNSLTVANARVPQSFTQVTPASNGANISGIDFGFNFSLVVNTRDAANCAVASSSGPCQGSLRQFLINATTLGGEGALAQSGNGQIDGSTTGLPSGFESSIFMIPDGTNNPGQPATFANQLTGGVAVITLASDLPAVPASTRLDATTQTVNIGNTNAGVLGSGGTVGVDGISLPQFPRPEVQLTSGNRTVTLDGNSAAMLGFALRQGYILVTGSSCLVRNNLVGMTASGDSSDNTTTTYGITFTGGNATVRNNFVTVNNSGIRTDNAGSGSLITLNEVARPTSGHSNTFDGILLVGTVSNIQVVANLTRDQAGGGIEVGFGGGAAASMITVNNNTVRGNGFTTAGGSTASSEPIGMAAYAYAGSSVVFGRNVVRDNAGPGIMLMGVSGTQVTQNSFSNNGGISIDLDPRTGMDPNSLGTPQGVTLNDNNDADSGPNGLRNYPVMVNAVLASGELLLGGFARPGAAIELYVAQADPSGFGEGLTYLGTLIEGSGADLDAGTGTYGPGNINGIAQGTDTTNRFSFRIPAPAGVAIGTRLTSTATISGETSEFGGNVLVTGGPSLQVTKVVQSFSDPVNGTTNPKSLPGATKLYVVTVTNQGAGAVDGNSVMVGTPVPPNTKLFVGNLGAPGSGPVAFVDGSPSSALTWTFSGLNNLTDDLEFSSDGGASWNYVPTADADGCDATITHVRMRPKGVMPGAGGGNPSFELQFRVVVL